MTRHPRSLLSLLVALAAIAGCTDNTGRPLELKFGHVGAPSSLYAASAEEFARLANERLGDRATVVVFGASQLGSDEVLLQKLRLGTVDFALPSTIMSSTFAEFGLFEMPYLVEDREHMGRIEEEILWPTLRPIVTEQGYDIIAVWENGFRHVTNSIRPIDTPEDLAGVKLRTPRGIWRVKMFQMFGANPTPMPLSEVFVALQTGVMDGQENPLAQIVSSKFHEIQPYLSLTGHVYSPAYVTVNADRWGRLPEDVQLILEETARETQRFVYDTAERMETEFLQEMVDANVVVNEPDLESFVAASQAVYDEFSKSVTGGRALLEHAFSLTSD
ncbi:MAG: TRAP transporter substrate-binding protein [Gammaproteobacteria bacterium]